MKKPSSAVVSCTLGVLVAACVVWAYVTWRDAPTVTMLAPPRPLGSTGILAKFEVPAAFRWDLHAVEGVVVGPDGAPVAGASVAVRRPGDLGMPGTGSTGPDGRFRLLVPFDGDCEVRAAAAGFPRSRPVPAATQGAEVRIQLEPEAILRGRARLDGVPVAGMQMIALPELTVTSRDRQWKWFEVEGERLRELLVDLEWSDSVDPRGFEAAHTTGSDGVFEVRGLPRGRYDVFLVPPDEGPRANALPAVARGVEAGGPLCEVPLQEGRVLTARVLGPDGRPVPVGKATIALDASLRSASFPIRDGRLEATALGTRPCVLEVEAPGFVTWHWNVVPGGPELELRLKVDEPLR